MKRKIAISGLAVSGLAATCAACITCGLSRVGSSSPRDPSTRERLARAALCVRASTSATVPQQAARRSRQYLPATTNGESPTLTTHRSTSASSEQSATPTARSSCREQACASELDWLPQGAT
eukprot:scaffold32296_cov63-Phaeocystis_antarctica.AAC.4